MSVAVEFISLRLSPLIPPAIRKWKSRPNLAKDFQNFFNGANREKFRGFPPSRGSEEGVFPFHLHAEDVRQAFRTALRDPVHHSAAGKKQVMAGESFLDLKQRLSQGDQFAANEIFRRYSGRLIGLARSKMAPGLQQKVDPEDVTQSVFRSFFTRQAANQVELLDWDSLWGLLALITVRKCARLVEIFRAARRNALLEQPLQGGGKENQPSTEWNIISGEPTPEQVALFSELLETIMSRLTPAERTMLSLSLQGDTPEEVAEKTQCSARSVRRLLQGIREELEQQIAS